jgi:hypothetical protein
MFAGEAQRKGPRKGTRVIDRDQLIVEANRIEHQRVAFP